MSTKTTSKTAPPKVSLTINTPSRGRPKKYLTPEAKLEALRRQKREYKERQKAKKQTSTKVENSEKKENNDNDNH